MHGLRASLRAPVSGAPPLCALARAASSAHASVPALRPQNSAPHRLSLPRERPAHTTIARRPTPAQGGVLVGRGAVARRTRGHCGEIVRRDGDAAGGDSFERAGRELDRRARGARARSGGIRRRRSAYPGTCARGQKTGRGAGTVARGDEARAVAVAAATRRGRREAWAAEAGRAAAGRRGGAQQQDLASFFRTQRTGIARRGKGASTSLCALTSATTNPQFPGATPSGSLVPPLLVPWCHPFWFPGATPSGDPAAGSAGSASVAQLRLGGNELAGSIPDSLSTLTHLLPLNLSTNHLWFASGCSGRHCGSECVCACRGGSSTVCSGVEGGGGEEEEAERVLVDGEAGASESDGGGGGGGHQELQCNVLGSQCMLAIKRLHASFLPLPLPQPWARGATRAWGQGGFRGGGEGGSGAASKQGGAGGGAHAGTTALQMSVQQQPRPSSASSLPSSNPSSATLSSASLPAAQHTFTMFRRHTCPRPCWASMALEYAQRGRVTTAADVFALGMVLLQLVSGRWPYDEEVEDRGLARWPGGHVCVCRAGPAAGAVHAGCVDVTQESAWHGGAHARPRADEEDKGKVGSCCGAGKA
ncbi:unnamed protein product [Closterium sp. Naga37s-1]|nr:unnamed protein product [Closterium sp. Naga37s-1]